jgi:hypothetical protein
MSIGSFQSLSLRPKKTGGDNIKTSSINGELEEHDILDWRPQNNTKY